MPGASLTAALGAARVFDGEQWFSEHAVLLQGECVQAVVPRTEVPDGTPFTDLGEGVLAPGLIDIQVNGGGGVMFNNQPDAEGVQAIVSAHRRFGTTGIMPTLISDTPASQRMAADAIAGLIEAGEAGVLGLHLEGPYFDLQRRGTHKAEMIRAMDDQDLAWLCSLTAFPVILSLAPEHAAAGHIRRLSEAGVLVCAGHTDADYETIGRAIDEGLRGFTHLYNAMSPLTAREPGTVGAALDNAATWAGIIADGHHVHPAAIRFAHRCKPPGKLLLVSDAMSTVGSAGASFELYGEHIEENEGRLVNAEGNLAGSAIALIDAVRIAHQQVGLDLGECLRMASLYPAAFLKLDGELGRLQTGYRADLLCFQPDFSVTDTWVAGVHQRHVER